MIEQRRETPPDPEADPRNWTAPRYLKEADPILGSPAERYLLARGISRDRLAATPLLFHRRMRHALTGECWPAILAPVVRVEDDRLLTLHLTFLSRDGATKAPVDRPRLFLGMRGRGVVKLDRGDDALGLGVGEGIETCLSTPFAPVWASLDSGTMSCLPVIPGVECLTIFADRDPAGEAAAVNLGRRWREAGRQVRILAPKQAGADFNDVLRARQGGP